MLYELSKLLKDNLENSICFRVGSHQYGLETLDSDEDWTCVWFNPEDHLRVFKKYPESMCNETDDLKAYSLGKFAHLLVKGNPNLVELCWEPPFYVAEKSLTKTMPLSAVHSILGEFMEGAKPYLITRSLVSSYAGHLLHVKSEIAKKDVTAKRLSHALRIGYSLMDLLETRTLSSFRGNMNLDFVRMVKTGKAGIYYALEVFNNLDRELTLMLPEEKDKFPGTEKLVGYIYIFFLDLYTENF